MENITYFDIEREINGEIVTFRKYINIDTGELVKINDNDNCNFVKISDTKFNIHCAAFCAPLPCNIAIYNATAPAVQITNSVCQNDFITISGGVISAPLIQCPSGSTLEYSTDGIVWSTTIPTYNQTVAMTIYTRCVCTVDTSVISLINSVTTVPSVCTPCTTLSAVTAPEIGIIEGFCSPNGDTYTDGTFITSGSTCPVGSTLQFSTDNINWSTTVPSYNQTTPVTIYTRCICDANNSIVSIVTSGTTAPDTCLLEPVLNIVECGTMCAVSTTGELIEFNMTTLSAITEVVMCTGLTYDSIRYADIAKTPDGNIYVNIAGFIQKVDSTDCSIISTHIIDENSGAGLSYFRNGKLIFGRWQQATDQMLDLKLYNPITGGVTMWADTNIANLTPAGDFIMVGNSLYVSLSEAGISPSNKFIYEFGINANGTWDGTAINLGMLPNGLTENEWFGLALVGGVIYAVNGFDIYEIDVNDVTNPIYIFTSTLASGHLTGAASIEDGIASCI